MADVNPEWVEAGARAWMARSTDQSNAAWQDARLRAAIFVDAAEPLIRADERERPHAGWSWIAIAQLRDAEAVAARLVEVICEQEEIIAAYRAAVAALVVENDNLRAQIAKDIEALHYPEAVFAYEVKADAARIARGES